MDIYQHKEIVLRWVRSCKTAEQLDLLTEIVRDFVVIRFWDKTESYEMELVKRELSDAIIERRVIVAAKRKARQLINPCLIVPIQRSSYLSK